MSNKNEQTFEPCIWLVHGHEDLSNARGWRPFEAFQEKADAIPENILKSMRQSSVGWFLPESAFPKDNYPRRWNRPAAHEQTIPQIFSNGFIMLSGESAEVVRSFDMGEGALYPVRLWHPDRETQVPSEFFYLSQGNKKDAFLRDRSEGFGERPNGRWRVHIGRPKAASLFFSSAALEGPDLWWDKSIADHFFISDRLKRALDECGLSADWHLMRCAILTED